MPKAFIELNEAGDRIRVFFAYNAQLKDAVRTIPGRRYVGKDDPDYNPAEGVHWTVPAELSSARKLRAIFGEDLELGEGVRTWGREEARIERNLKGLSIADDADLERLPVVAPTIARIINGDPVPELGLSKKHPLSRKRPARPYQRADIAMMAQANVINANHPGCMAWNTMVEINRGGRGKRTGKSYKLNIAQLYRRFNGRDKANYNFDKTQPTRIRARTSDGYIRLVELEAVYDSGVKQTYMVTTNTGRSVRATHDHPFLTPNGWRKLGKLKPGDEVYVEGGVVARGRRPKRGRERMVNLQHHPYARQRKRGNSVAYHHIVAEATLNGMTTEEFITAVRGSPKYSKRGGLPESAKGLKFLPPTVVVHHDDGDHSNNDPSNLVVMNSQSDHARAHGLWQNFTATTTTERVVSVEKDVRTHTYDIELAGAPHNFLANGFVVHNTGKTLEMIGAVVEASLELGIHLVAAPRTSLRNTWQVEVERLLPGALCFTSENPSERRKAVERGLAVRKGCSIWIFVIFDDLRLKKIASRNDIPETRDEATKHPLYARKDHKGNVYAFQSELHKKLVGTKLKSFTVDEFHKSGLNNPLSLFTLGTDMIKAERQWRMSGTPMGGKPIKLFPVLRSIDPKTFSSKWRWAGEWLDIEDNRFGKKIGGLKSDMEDLFYEAHARYMVRRLKREALPGLPRKVIEVVSCDMTPKQEKQYIQFDKDAEVRVEGVHGTRTVVGDCILAEYTRLRQFANGYCVMNEKGEVVPTEDSGKLPYLWEKLDEFGVRPVMMRSGKPIQDQSYEPGARAIVASQSLRMVEMVSAWLTKQGVPNGMLTGKTKDSKPIIDRFKDLDDEMPYIIVMTTPTGGVSLNLEEASSIHILDESWNPDDDEQLEDRGDRGTRDTPLVCLYYRTTGTVQEYIAKVAEGKKLTNANLLDVYREIKKLKEDS